MTDEVKKEVVDEAEIETEEMSATQPEPVDNPSSQQTPVTQSAASTGGASSSASDIRGTVDLDAELNAKELLADQLAAGVIGSEDYAKKVVVHDRNIIKAQRAMLEPAKQVQQTFEQQKVAQQYWTNWGSGKDVAQLQFGKTVKADLAAALFREAKNEVLANPRYQGRNEIDPESIAYDKWMDKMDAESKKKPAPANTSTPQTRVSGDTPVSQSGGTGPRRTAREKLEAGEYDLST